MSAKKASKRGGAREGAGRPAGRKNSSTIELERLSQDALRRGKPKDGELTSLEFFRAIYRDEHLPYATRAHAASKAMPYEHSQLRAVEHSGPDGGPIAFRAELVRTEIAGELDRIRRNASESISQPAE